MKKAFIIIGILVMITITVVGAILYQYTRPTIQLKKTVVYASLSEMTSADPSTEFSNSIMWLPLVYETLVMYDAENNRYIPALAERWESLNNGTVWVFYIKKGVKFHDGSVLTAWDVKISIERTMSLGMGAYYIWDPVDRIEVKDNHTIVFYLRYPAPLPKIAATPYGAYIFCSNVIGYANANNTTDSRIAEWFNRGNDCGSGPYRLAKWDPESEIILEKFVEWWGWQDPHFPFKSSIDKAPDIFVIKIIKDAATQSRMLRAKEVHIAQQVPVEDIEDFEKDPNYIVVRKPSYQNLVILFNTRKPPLDNLLVRKAIAHAIPYEDIVRIARGGLATVSSGFVPHSMWGHVSSLRYEYNKELAKQLLAEGGYPNGIPRKLILTYTAGDIYEARTAEIIKASLAGIGIDIEIRPLSWEEQWALAQEGWKNPEAAQDILMFYWWSDILSPYTYLFNMFHSASRAFNLCYYENSEYEKLIEQAFVLEGSDPDKALRLYIEAQKILHEDVPGIPLWDMIDIRVARRGIKNLENAISPAYPTVIFAQMLVVEE